ncbi:TonB-dependent receptor [Pseudomaricurvus alkylphenolicus]|uniref:TonB-dependent receptor n=1 Tax=Pseudomaricurvus alkylphenolicus TaxID=1306991 RepID=UPI00141DC6AF|nr:TonB-dependent receptor [Pseudomaricurvus alkylphenolicus]NIB38457.1 TonB-dependent receptor [Pseudomaricurvus alkylphenolicus]
MQSKSSSIKPLAFLISTFCFPGAAIAADAGKEAYADSESLLEEIVVYAQKRQERLMDVPISMTALSSDVLEKTSALALEDVVTMVPNVQFVNLDSNAASLFTLRGFGSDTTNGGLESGVAVYHDGVYLGRSGAFNAALLDLATVEVLRGPQGTLYGRNSTLGAFNIISKKPSNEVEGAIDIGVGNYDQRTIKGHLNLPVNDRLALRGAVISTERDGYLDNAFTGESINDKDSLGGRLLASYQASDDLQITFSIDAQRDRSNGGTKDITPSPEDQKSLTDRQVNEQEGADDRDIWGTAITLSYSLGDHQLTSITSYRGTDLTYIADIDQTPDELVDAMITEDQYQISQELRIDSPDSDRLTWSAGFYYFTQDFDRETQIEAPGFGGLSALWASSEVAEAYALFGNASYDLSDALSVSMGLRYTWEEKTIDFYQNASFPGFINVAPFTETASSEALSPSLVVNYTWSEELNSYAKVVRGFKSGGFNATSGTSPGQAEFDPEYITSYEVGVKSSFPDSNLTFNAAVYYLDYTEQQVNMPGELPGQSTVVNTGEVAGRGLEMDMTYRPTENLMFVASAGYSKVLKEDGPERANLPRWNGSLAAQYDYKIAGEFSGFIRADLNYRSEFYSTRNHIFNNSDVVLVNARAGINLNQWQVYLWGRNLTDEEVFSNTAFNGVAGGINSNMEPPRTFGIGAKFTY